MAGGNLFHQGRAGAWHADNEDRQFGRITACPRNRPAAAATTLTNPASSRPLDGTTQPPRCRSGTNAGFRGCQGKWSIADQGGPIIDLVGYCGTASFRGS